MSEKEVKTCNTDTQISLDFPFVRGIRIYRPRSQTYGNTPSKGFSGSVHRRYRAQARTQVWKMLQASVKVMRGMRIVFAKSESCLEFFWARIDLASARFRLTEPSGC
jgi:hypothetical protein